MGMPRRFLIKSGMVPQKWMRETTGAGRKSIKRETKRRRRQRAKEQIRLEEQDEP